MNCDPAVFGATPITMDVEEDHQPHDEVEVEIAQQTAEEHLQHGQVLVPISVSTHIMSDLEVE